MKKNRFSSAIAGVAAAAVMCAALPTLTIGAAQTLVGDVDKNGTVGVTDLVLLTKYIHGSTSLDQDAYDNANVIGDESVDVFDLTCLKNIVLNADITPSDPGQETPEPGEEDPIEVVTPTGTNEVASIVFGASGVTLYDANGAEIAAADASNVVVENGTYVTIAKARTADPETGKVPEYSISGTCDNGQLRVCTDNTADPTAAVELSLEGLTLSNSSVAPIYIENVGDSATITVKKDTVNTISDGQSHTDSFTNSSGEVKEIDGAIYCRDDLKIKGKGTLIVNGNYADGIVCKNDLKIWNSTIEVNATDDGIRAGNSVRIGDPDTLVANGGDGDYGNLNITVKTQSGDGIKATETDADKGFVTINGGTINIASYADGIQAEQNVTINGGDINITTYEGSNYGGTASGSTGGWGGGMGMDGNANKTDISAKGIKAIGLYDESGTTWQSQGNITITGGNITVDSSDDAVHCGGDLTVTGGIFTIATADDAFHSDHSLTIGTKGANTYDDVQIFVSKCYEGIEGTTINQNSGTVYIISGDDGYNAAGGADGSGSANPGGWGQGGMSSSSGSLNLNGGVAVVNSASGDHDAFDSNGAFTVTGGYYCANGQEPCDYDGAFSNNGGTFITMSAGNGSLNTSYTFTDASGNAVATIVSASGAGLKSGSAGSAVSGAQVSGGTEILTQAGNYKVTIGGSVSGGNALGAASEGGMQPGGPGSRP